MQLLSELPGGNSHWCWKEPSPSYCNTVLELEQRCWPWSSRKESVLISSVQCENCFWGCTVEGCSGVCCGKRTQYSLLWSNTAHQVQLITSGVHLVSFVEMFSQFTWLCVWPCLMRSTSPSAQCYPHFCGLYLLSWFISVKEPAMQPLFQSQLKFTCVLLLPFLKFTDKTWLSWPAKVTQQQLIMLSSTFVSMWIGGWSTSVGMAPTLGWCGVLAQSVTLILMLGRVAALCCLCARVLSRWL